MNKRVTKRLKKKFKADQTIANQELEIRKLCAEVLRLKELIACCGKMAAETNDRKIVDLAGRTLKGFKIDSERYREIIQEFKGK